MLENVLSGYTPEKRAKDQTTLYVYWVLRRVSFWLTPVFLKRNVSANTISVLGIVFAVVAAALIAVGSYWVVIAGVLLLQLWLLLDCTDGNVARCTKVFTSLGRFLEDIADCLVPALLFSSVGVAAARMPGYVPFGFAIPSSTFMALGILSALAVTFRKLIFRNFQIIYWGGQEQKNITFFGTGVRAFVYQVAQNLLGVYSFIHVVLLGAAVFRLLGLFTIVYFVLNTVGMVLNVAQMIRRAVVLGRAEV